ncbi:MAG: cysteine hydrolase family protein [Reichenbachiella sp.]|uniref:cysteine hydrolase family protein n=1 Tax=Reichenbachiella sp. TaxID=2184521 RepID=UPI0032677342
MSTSKTALVLIDIQDGLDAKGYYGAERNNPTAEDNCKLLLDHFRESEQPIFHIKHNSTLDDSPLHPSQPGNQIKSIVSPVADEPIFEKNVNSAFIGTPLEEELNKLNISRLVMVGLTTEHCVSTSVRMAANLGFEVLLPMDATAAFSKVGANDVFYDAETIHQTTLATLKDEFATILSTNSVLLESAN